jgi:phosphoserine aminotransferase
MAQPYDRVFNFSAGPCTLPVEVLEEARDGLLNYRGTGMSVMEMSHRSKAFESIIAEAEADLRALVGIPDDYAVMFLQGGASLQFSMTPMCFLSKETTADYVVTGSWGKKAVESAKLEGCVKVVFDGKADNYNDIKPLEELDLTPGAAYVHITSNETIQGVEYPSDPQTEAPLICDMSSDILSRPFDVSRYALIYAGAQKNMGPAGLTVVIARKDLLEKVPANMHPMLDYRLQAENGSMYNTPPCWSIYIAGLVYKRLLATGGLEAAKQRNDTKAKVIYDAIDSLSSFYKGHAKERARSIMNVTFTLPSEELTKQFVKESEQLGLDGLKGHRSVGGIRASIYNAFPLEGAQALAGFMKEFAAKHSG